MDFLKGAIPYDEKIIKEYTQKGWWLNLTFGDLLDRAVERNRDKVAVIDEHTIITYGELKRRVDQFACSLIRLGVKKYDRILIQLPNCHEYLVAFYGMQRIGAVPVLAIPRHGEGEISNFIHEMEPVGWILPVQDGKLDFKTLVEKISPRSNGVKHVIMIADGNDIPADSLSFEDLLTPNDNDESVINTFKERRPDPNDVAVILFTGGTTGMPKGVPRTHNSYLANIRYCNKDMRANDVRSAVTPVGHAMANQGAVGGSIFHANSLCMIPVPRSGAILSAIEKHRVTSLTMVPTQLKDILADPNLKDFDLSSLRKVVTAGAALSSKTAEEAKAFFEGWGAQFGGGGFGSSEGPCAMHRLGAPDEVVLNAIGAPTCDGDHWKVIDENENELPIGSEGELVAKGPCVFTGYLHSDKENHTIFTQDGYYKMGDLGYMDKDGYIYITGRKKDIIQRGGEGIIPSEIEKLLYRHPHIVSAAVVAMPDPRLGEKACAYVNLKSEETMTFEEMVAFLKNEGASVLQLPERLEIVNALPLTKVGKIDKVALQKDIIKKTKEEG
jgi:2,3-dihydroxybenzoate---[aryl-carrier protein] ligase